jgi:hypothetical protein
MRRYWLVAFYKNGFEGKMLVYGTEQELWDYLNSEIGGGDERHTGNYRYSGASEADIKAAKQLGIKAYLAPEINK